MEDAHPNINNAQNPLLSLLALASNKFIIFPVDKVKFYNPQEHTNGNKRYTKTSYIYTAHSHTPVQVSDSKELAILIRSDSVLSVG